MEEKYVVYVGTYTHENSIGIHLYDLDAKSGEMKERKVVPINNPSDLLVSKDGRFLYSIADEGVEAFHILPDGDLEPMNKQWIGGMRGCYVEVDSKNRYLYADRRNDLWKKSMLFMSERIPMRTVSESIYMIWMQKAEK